MAVIFTVPAISVFSNKFKINMKRLLTYAMQLRFYQILKAMQNTFSWFLFYVKVSLENFYYERTKNDHV